MWLPNDPWRCRHAAGLIAAVVLAGCSGPAPAGLEGSVSFRGRRVQVGAIRLFPSGGTPGHGAGAAITAGRYRIEAGKGLVAGTYRIEAVAFEETGRTEPEEQLDSRGPKTVPETRQILPPSCNEQSTLAVTIKAGENLHDLVLE